MLRDAETTSIAERMRRPLLPLALFRGPLLCWAGAYWCFQFHVPKPLIPSAAIRQAATRNSAWDTGGVCCFVCS